MNPKIIDTFDGEFRFLSNFWPSKVHYDGMEYRSVEHAYQAAKALDKDERLKEAVCGCWFYQQNHLRQGPCAHILALRVAAKNSSRSI